MQILREALLSIRTNLFSVAGYAAVCAIANAMYALSILFMQVTGRITPDESLPPIYEFTSDVILSIIYALAQTIFFSRIGREIDKPLWKIEGDYDALKRFFRIWLLLQLVTLALMRLSLWHSVFLALFPWAYIVTIPVGACLMFEKASKWSEVPQCMQPLIGNFFPTLLVLFINFVSLVIQLYYAGIFGDIRQALNESALTLSAALINTALSAIALQTIASFVDCLVFAGTWHICRMNRDASPNSDLDF